MDDLVVVKLRRDITITPVNLSHAINMYRWMRDPLIRENLGLSAEPSIERTYQWIKNIQLNPSALALAILLDGRHVGNVVIEKMDADSPKARLSVYIGDAADRGHGIGATGLYLAMAQAFEQLYLNKIYLTVDCCNAAAIRTYSRLGFIQEGSLRKEFPMTGGYGTALYMGILRPEFDSLEIERI